MPSEEKKLFSASQPTHNKMKKQYLLNALAFIFKVFFVPYIYNVIGQDADSLKSFIFNLYLQQSLSNI